MQVKALENGFHDGRRVRMGQTFEVPDGTKAKWFEPVDAAKPGKKAAATAPNPVALSELGKAPKQTFNDVMRKDGAEADKPPIA